jgi:hypothetical protein
MNTFNCTECNKTVTKISEIQKCNRCATTSTRNVMTHEFNGPSDEIPDALLQKLNESLVAKK